MAYSQCIWSKGVQLPWMTSLGPESRPYQNQIPQHQNNINKNQGPIHKASLPLPYRAKCAIFASHMLWSNIRITHVNHMWIMRDFSTYYKHDYKIIFLTLLYNRMYPYTRETCYFFFHMLHVCIHMLFICAVSYMYFIHVFYFYKWVTFVPKNFAIICL